MWGIRPFPDPGQEESKRALECGLTSPSFSVAASSAPPGGLQLSLYQPQDGTVCLRCAGHCFAAGPVPCILQRRKLRSGEMRGLAQRSQNQDRNLGVPGGACSEPEWEEFSDAP